MSQIGEWFLAGVLDGLPDGESVLQLGDFAMTRSSSHANCKDPVSIPIDALISL
jgi:glutamine synthetase